MSAAPSAAANEMRIVLLGTGAGITPKTGRQATAAAVVSAGQIYVVDCGNGVGPQLLRAGLALGALRAIFITHHHLDHVADFGTLLAQCWAQLTQPVALIGPPPLRRMFELFLQMFAVDLESRIAEEGRSPLANFVSVHEITGTGDCYRDGDLQVSFAGVAHPPLEHAFAYKFASSDAVIVFSGDTAPSAALARFARGAHTLVHEATFPAALAHEFSGPKAEQLLVRLAIAHSPVTEAARIAATAGVRRLVLSPLAPSTGVTDSQWLAAAADHFEGEIIVGRDLLELPV